MLRRAALRKAPSIRFSSTVSLGNSRRPSGTMRHAEIDDGLGRQPGQIVRGAVDRQRHAAALRPDQAGDALHQRALAVAVGAEQCDGLAGLDMET